MAGSESFGVLTDAVSGALTRKVACLSSSSNGLSWSLVVAATSEELLRENLFRSGEVHTATDMSIQWKARSSAAAYNAGLRQVNGEVVVFAHQDVFLPAGWTTALQRQLERLQRRDRNWGVVGLYGVTRCGNGAGYVYSQGLRRFVGQPFQEPVEVLTLDEMLLVVRRCSGLSFDENMPGFHLYGTDICLQADARSMTNYVIPCFALHNSQGLKRLPPAFWRAYLYLRRKWWHQLPVITPCTTVSTNCEAMFHHLVQSAWLSLRRKNNPGMRVRDAKRFYEEQILGAFRRSEGNGVQAEAVCRAEHQPKWR